MANESAATNNAKVLFKFGTQSKYDALETKDEKALYFIEDTKRIYKGSELYSSQEAQFVTEVPAFETAVEKVMYVVTNEAGTVSLYIKGDSAMVPLSSVATVEAGGIQSTSAFADGVLITSDTGLTGADDTAIPTAGAVNAALEDVTSCWEAL